MSGGGRLSGRTALVTGGASGIGAAIVRRFAAEGAAVAIGDRDVVGAERVRAELAQEGRRGLALALEVTDRASVVAALDATEATLGRLDLLVTSAGISRPAPFLELADADWAEVLAVNLGGTFLCVQEAGRRMAARGFGRIVCIASNCARRATSYRAAYNASKAGVVSLVQSAAIELAPFGVTVNALSPGPVDSPMARRNHTPALRRAILEVTPLRRYAHAEEVAAAALFLASAEASYLTGHELSLDGGAGAALYLYEDRPDDRPGSPAPGA
jgi:NAD(P)-dependent dehydrogenase (short-subunit alcohol dehydrogenase family)